LLSVEIIAARLKDNPSKQNSCGDSMQEAEAVNLLAD